MTTVALSWLDDGRIRVAELPSSRRSLVSRSADADVTIPHPTVSRPHLAIGPGSSGYLVEHLSRTNPTRINGSPVHGPTPLSDGDAIVIGTVSATFHDLAAGDRRQGPVCHNCHRENDASQRDCWFCGTSLVNAPTTIRMPRPVLCRILGPNGAHADLYEGMVLVLSPEGNVTATRKEGAPDPRTAHVELREGQAMFVPPNEGGSAVAAQPIATGDEFSIAGSIRRTPRDTRPDRAEAGSMDSPSPDGGTVR